MLGNFLYSTYHFFISPPFPRGRLCKALFRFTYIFVSGVMHIGRFFQRAFIVHPLLYSQCQSYGKKITAERLPYITGFGHLIIDDKVYLSGKQSINFYNIYNSTPVIQIGKNTFIGHDVSLGAAERLLIGNNCYIAASCYISDTLNHPINATARRNKEKIPPNYIKSIIIKDDVWIGRNVIILKGVTVGERSIIGAGTVVTKDVPADCIVAGNPARLIRELKNPLDGFV